MTEYQDWNDSRWDYMKSQSNWHFDTQRIATEGADSYYHICRFDADWTDAIARCMPLTRGSTWGDRNNWNPKVAAEGLYSATAEEKDLISHRGKSLRAIAPHVISLLTSLG